MNTFQFVLMLCIGIGIYALASDMPTPEFTRSVYFAVVGAVGLRIDQLIRGAK